MKKITVLFLLLHLTGCDGDLTSPANTIDAKEEAQPTSDAGVTPDVQISCTPARSTNGMPVFQDCQAPDGKIGTCFQGACCFGCLKYNLVGGVPQFYQCQDGSANSACGGNGSTCDNCDSQSQQCLKSAGNTFACFK